MDYDFVKTFPVKVTEPKAFDELPISKLLNYLTQMKIQHLPKGIREYVSRNPADFKDYLDEISAETKYLSTISRLMQGTESGGEFCRLQRTQGMLQMKM
ncbi:hypothetical protein PROFUN_14753 [Planoprotostelium fungivorum]|uniref:Uncharacterized protein n=1 Tax=Planoprotostelium fungivorum TaxID=1890364 RepID=A0A2P6MXY7_9EUKA|nr:hypothetical protein PROFUN_14753 [Planoprotostelium fungivorum]